MDTITLEDLEKMYERWKSKYDVNNLESSMFEIDYIVTNLIEKLKKKSQLNVPN